MFWLIVTLYFVYLYRSNKQEKEDSLKRDNAAILKELAELKSQQTKTTYKRSTWTQHNPW